MTLTSVWVVKLSMLVVQCTVVVILMEEGLAVVVLMLEGLKNCLMLL